MKPRNIWIASLLLIFTFGLYHLYWQSNIQRDIYKQKNIGFDGWVHAVLVVFTLGFYSLYWHMVLRNRIGDACRPLYAYIYAVSFVMGYILLLSGAAIVFERSLLILFRLDLVNAPRWNFGVEAWILIGVGAVVLVGRFIAAILIQIRINTMQSSGEKNS